jgi:hypothetical protein
LFHFSFDPLSTTYQTPTRPSSFYDQLTTLTTMTDNYKQSLLDAIQQLNNNTELSMDTGRCFDICIQNQQEE